MRHTIEGVSDCSSTLEDVFLIFILEPKSSFHAPASQLLRLLYSQPWSALHPASYSAPKHFHGQHLCPRKKGLQLIHASNNSLINMLGLRRVLLLMKDLGSWTGQNFQAHDCPGTSTTGFWCTK